MGRPRRKFSPPGPIREVEPVPDLDAVLRRVEERAAVEPDNDESAEGVGIGLESEAEDGAEHGATEDDEVLVASGTEDSATIVPGEATESTEGIGLEAEAGPQPTPRSVYGAVQDRLTEVHAVPASERAEDEAEVQPGFPRTEPTEERVRVDTERGGPAQHSTEPAAAPGRGRDNRRQRRMQEREEAREARRAARPRYAPPQQPPLPVYTANDDLPPEERPMQRDGFTVGPIQPPDGMDLPDFAGRPPPGNLTELCQLFPIGNGQHYIRVERTQPKSFGGRSIAGLLTEIRYPIAEVEFARRFGGGHYELVVYGPDPTGRPDPLTGQTMVKPLTKKIGVDYPGNPILEASDMDPGIPGYPGYGRRPLGPTGMPSMGPADASAMKSNLDFAGRLITEERAENRELRRQVAAQPASNAGALEPVLGVMKEQTKLVADSLGNEANRQQKVYELQINQQNETISALRDELRRLRDKPVDNNAGAWGAMAEVVKAAAPQGRSSDELTRITDSHRDELRRVNESHRDDNTRREEAHKREVEGVRSTYEERIRILNSEVETERRRGRDDVANERRIHEDREKQLRDQYDERIRQTGDRHAADLERMRTDHQRELQSVERNANLVAKTKEVSLETRITSLQEQLDRARNEAADKEDLEAQLAKTEHMASLLGFTRNEGPKDWKEHLAAAFSHAISNADKILDAGARTLAAAKAAPGQPGGPPGPQQQQMGPPPGYGPPPGLPPHRGRPSTQATRTWAVDEGAPLPVDYSAGKQTPPQYGPPPVQQQPVQPAPPAPQPQPMYPVTPQAYPQQQQVAPPPDPGPPGPPPNGAHPGPQVTPQDMEVFRIMAEQRCLQGALPASFAEELVGKIGLENARAFLTAITAERLHEALSGDPNMASSPLVRRDGQRWLAQVFLSAREIVFPASGAPAPAPN